MSGASFPRQILAGPAAQAIHQLALTNSLIDFLRAQLRTYKATVRKRGGPFTDDRLAQEIHYCPALSAPAEFGPETLRRFLKNIRQNHNDSFFIAIAEFLLHEKWISPADLAAHRKDAALQAAGAMQTFFGIEPDQQTLTLYKQLEGTYIRYQLGSDRFVKIHLTLTRHHEPPALRALEVMHFYRTMAARQILLETDGLKPEHYHKLPRILRTYAQEVGAPQHSPGFAVADSRIIGFFVRSQLTGHPTVYLADTLIERGKAHNVLRLRTARYAGWKPVDVEPEPSIELIRTSDEAGEGRSMRRPRHGATDRPS